VSPREYGACKLDCSWRNISFKKPSHCDLELKTGGLGKLLNSTYMVWACVQGDSCAGGSENHFCYVYNEDTRLFVPWGKESDLQLLGGSEISESEDPTDDVTEYPAVLSVDDLGTQAMEGFVLEGIDSSDALGWFVGGRGCDFNGDGFDDVFVSGRHANHSAPDHNVGEIYVLYGTDQEISDGIDLRNLNGQQGFTIVGRDEDDEAGYSVSCVKDLNGDSLDDIVIGAISADPVDGQVTGAAYVVFGRTSPVDRTVWLGSLNGANGFRIRGMAIGDRTGISVAGVGDLNDDGLNDLAVGAEDFDTAAGSNAGQCFIIFGSNSPFPADFNLATLDGSNGFTVPGVLASGKLGHAVSAAGDVNNDNIADLLVSAYSAGPNGVVTSGIVYAIFGSNQGFGPSLDLNSLNGTNGFVVEGQSLLQAVGDSVSNAGDVNGDGIDDIVLGMWDLFTGAADRAWVIYGKNVVFPGTLGHQDLDGVGGFRLNGFPPQTESGSSVASVGDVNGDGISDIIVGARSASPGGEAFVVFGSNAFGPELDVSTLNGVNGFKISGGNAMDTKGVRVSGAGDFNSDGVSDPSQLCRPCSSVLAIAHLDEATQQLASPCTLKAVP